MSDLIPAMRANFNLQGCKYLVKYIMNGPFVFTFFSDHPAKLFNVVLIVLSSNYRFMRWESIKFPSMKTDSDLEPLTASGKSEGRVAWSINIHYNNDHTLSIIYDESGILARAKPMYANVPILYTKKGNRTIIGIATNHIEMCKIRELQPHINKIKMIIFVLNEAPFMILEDVQKYIVGILIELIRLDPESYVA